jgi:pimeloyl-ACP methyl ester carboxylesterase
MSTMTTVTSGPYTFEVFESGPADGEVVLLLHGFPQHADCWSGLARLLAEAGYRTVAFNQRGYSPGARPAGRGAYRSRELVADAAAVIDAYGGRAHVVGHDLGAGLVAWGLTAAHPEKVATLTAVSGPHPKAYMKALVTSSQALCSWYMLVFQLPWLPERLFPPLAGRLLVKPGGQTPALVRRDIAAYGGPEGLSYGLNWYRAIPFNDPRRPEGGPSRRPTLIVWSDKDIYVTRKSVENSVAYVQDAPCRLEILTGHSHWLPDQAPAELAKLLLPHLAAHRMSPAAAV